MAIEVKPGQIRVIVRGDVRVRSDNPRVVIDKR